MWFLPQFEACRYDYTGPTWIGGWRATTWIREGPCTVWGGPRTALLLASLKPEASTRSSCSSRKTKGNTCWSAKCGQIHDFLHAWTDLYLFLPVCAWLDVCAPGGAWGGPRALWCRDKGNDGCSVLLWVSPGNPIAEKQWIYSCLSIPRKHIKTNKWIKDCINTVINFVKLQKVIFAKLLPILIQKRF